MIIRTPEYLEKQRLAQRCRNEIKNKARGGIPCPVCGYIVMSIGSHVKKFHGVSARDFRISQGFTINHTLTAPSLHKYFVDKGKEMGKLCDQNRIEKMMVACRKRDRATFYRGREYSDIQRKVLKTYITPENRGRLAKGHKKSELHKQRISEAKKGTRHSEEARKKMSLAHIGKKLSAASILKRTNTRKTRRYFFKHSEETKQRMRTARLSYLKEKRLT